MVNVIKMRPRHRAALLIVGMYCAMLYFRGGSEYVSLMFLMYGLMIVYGYGGGVEEFEKIAVCQHGVRLKSLLFYGGLFFFFLWITFGTPPPYKKIQ